MKLIKVASGVVNQTPLDWDGNQKRILGAIAEARRQGASILCLPEMCITGYGCEDAFYAPFVHETALQVLLEIVPETTGMIVTVGLPLVMQNKIFNTACLLVDGKIIGFVAKRFLAGDGIHYEPRWFMPWKAGQRGWVEINDERYPVGDFYFEVGGVKIGFEICEDAWVANRPGRDHYLNGVDLILNPSASHFAFGKINIRKRFVLEGSRAFGVGYIYSNLMGNESGRAIYDGGAIIASAGELLAVGDRLSFAEFAVTTAVLDIEMNRMAQLQSRAPFERASTEEAGIEVPFVYPQLKPTMQKPVLAEWEESKHHKEEEFARALALGLYDYMRKSRSNGFVISLSGGADSAALACLTQMMIVLGIDSIGEEAFKAKLAYLKDLPATIEGLTACLLTTAYQPSENSGDVTRNAAEKLASYLHAQHYELYVGDIVKAYTDIVANSLNRPLTWEQDDLALQNIQARVRAPSVWMLANIQNALLVSTSNRSEAAVGYATMDGDTAGGLSPIAGIDKAFLRHWLRWLEKTGCQTNAGFYTVSALSYINEQQPTAELRPQETKQTDEADLMPYDLLDEVEEAAIRDKKNPIACFELLSAKFPQYSPTQLKEWITKFFRLWCRNQWKRERYAPSFHLDDKNLDPKTWCRFPILSGGFERELKALKDFPV